MSEEQEKTAQSTNPQRVDLLNYIAMEAAEEMLVPPASLLIPLLLVATFIQLSASQRVILKLISRPEHSAE